MPWQARGFPSWVMFLRIYVVCRLIRDYRTQQLTFSDQNARLMAKNMHLLAQNHRVDFAIRSLFYTQPIQSMGVVAACQEGPFPHNPSKGAPIPTGLFTLWSPRAGDFHRRAAHRLVHGQEE